MSAACFACLSHHPLSLLAARLSLRLSPTAKSCLCVLILCLVHAPWRHKVLTCHSDLESFVDANAAHEASAV